MKKARRQLKPRSDAWDADLTDAQRWQAYDMFRRSSWYKVAEWAAEEFSVPPPSRAALYRWAKRMRGLESAHRIEQAVQARDEIGALAHTTATDAALIDAYKSMAAEAAVAQAEADLAQADAIVESNEVWTLSFDWPAPARVPYHPRQNVLAWTAKVAPTNIAGTLYEDHYVCFNAAASTNPAVILIEYARTLDGGEVERVSAAVVTNSHPEMSVVELQSGSYTCYWFRCEVPAAYTACVRDWNGEALFGSPADSEKGFDLLGTLVIDDGGDVWVGATTNIVIGGVTNTIRNGIVTKD